MKKIYISLASMITLLVGISSTAFADNEALPVSQALNGISTGIEETVITPQSLPCDYYSNGQHRQVVVGTSSVGYSGGTHSAVIVLPSGAQQAVNCNITNWYTMTTYNCACGRVPQNVTGGLIFTTHQYSH